MHDDGPDALMMAIDLVAGTTVWDFGVVGRGLREGESVRGEEGRGDAGRGGRREGGKEGRRDGVME